MIRLHLKNLIQLVSANSIMRIFWYVKRGNFLALLHNGWSVLKDSSGVKFTKSYNLSVILNGLTLKPQFTSINSESFDIIVPVYNGVEFIRRALQSLAENTPEMHRIIIVDDCSTDSVVVAYLNEFSCKYSNVILIRNVCNLGFVRSVNAAAALTSGHFVIVNSDVEVPPGWLSRLMSPILNQNNIASTTPFTNAGGICSFPVMNRDNDIFDSLDLTTIDSCFQKISLHEGCIEIPTGIGFCMGINRKTYEAIGMFDEALFEKGYGEENDWCMRAYKCGYRHLLVPNLFVYHKHGGSFSSEEKTAAIERNLPKLIGKYPEYQGLVNAFSSADPAKKLRDGILLLLSSLSAAGSELIIDHNLGGGASHYRDELVRKRIAEGRSVLLLLYDYHANVYSFIQHYKEFRTVFAMDGVRDVLEIAKYIKIDRIIINSFVTFSNVTEVCDIVLKLQTEFGCKLRFLLHDFFPVCPSYNLLNQVGKYCSIPPVEMCSPCIRRHHGDSLFHHYGMSITEWRSLWSGFLQRVDEIVCFSFSSRDIFRKAYPKLPQEKMIIEPHVVDYLDTVCPKRPEGQIVIGVLGSINHAKGIEILKALSVEIGRSRRPFRIVVIGRTSEKIPGKNVTVTGGYERKDLPQLILNHQVHVILIPSLWPETFSYTTEEAMQMRIPVAVFNLGAPAERVKNYPLGVIIDSYEPLKILDELQHLAHRAGY